MRHQRKRSADQQQILLDKVRGTGCAIQRVPHRGGTKKGVESLYGHVFEVQGVYRVSLFPPVSSDLNLDVFRFYVVAGLRGELVDGPLVVPVFYDPEVLNRWQYDECGPKEPPLRVKMPLEHFECETCRVCFSTLTAVFAEYLLTLGLSSDEVGDLIDSDPAVEILCYLTECLVSRGRTDGLPLDD